jgi:uncharacterized iron-regulated membrane protein
MPAMSGQTTSALEKLGWLVPRSALVVTCLSVALIIAILGLVFIAVWVWDDRTRRARLRRRHLQLQEQRTPSGDS